MNVGETDSVRDSALMAIAIDGARPLIERDLLIELAKEADSRASHPLTSDKERWAATAEWLLNHLKSRM